MAQEQVKSNRSPMPRVVVFGFASCFGCQLQITNVEKHLMDVLGQIDLRYWQLVSSEPLPDEFDVAVIEGAITHGEALELVKEIRQRAKAVISIGSCAGTAGIPALASERLEDNSAHVYGNKLPEICGELVKPLAIKDVVPVDFAVHCCPIDPYAFIDILLRALYGSNKSNSTTTLCGSCKINQTPCLYERGEICLGLVTRSGCGARCPKLGRACNGCAGLSPDANIQSACDVVASYGRDPEVFRERLALFNTNELTGKAAQ